MSTRSVIFDVIGRDNASKAFLSAGRSAETAAAGVDRSIAKLEAAGARMQVVGQRMSKAITLPVIAAVGVSIDQAVKFQKSMTLLQTAGGETAAKMTVISKGIMDVAKSTGTSLHDLSDGMYTVAKAGSQKWSAVDQLKVLKAAAQGAKAENVDLGTATAALTSVMMSYHVPASQAVKVQNELVIAAGRSKTTMQEFAGALATVVPIASSAHISFAQIGGAIATLTQHGTSAQEATQELANTIRNLQAPNNVAIKAMQQLGINVTDVSKNLGKRGLTGTIDLVTGAIEKKMGKSGLVVVSAFKQSQSATADLSLELAHMSPHLADISRQFESGKLGYKDYYSAVKALGGQQFELGKGFIATMGQAKGFNDLLKAGSPAARTFAAYLKQIMGGSTGLNTALQLGGENMAYFKKTTDDVAAAAKKAGADVLGWGKTQDTLAVKMDKAKANLQVLAVEVGTALIPAVSKLVGWITTAVTWFDNLSSGSKKFIGYTVLVIAALGPLIAIAGRVTKVLALMWTVGTGVTRFIGGVSMAEMSLASMQTKAYTAGLSLRTAFTGPMGSVKALGSALAGVAAGTSIGLLTRHASGAQQALGALGSTAVGAASGFAIGGPWGAAIGGAVGLLSNLAANFIGAGKAAKTAVQPTDEYTQAILRDNLALGRNTRAVAANRLLHDKVFDLGRKIGATPFDLTSAALGNAGAKARILAEEQTAGLGAYNRLLAAARSRNAAAAAAAKPTVTDAVLQEQAWAKLTKGQQGAVVAARQLNEKLSLENQTLKASIQAAKDYANATSAAGKNDSARVKALKAVTAEQTNYTKSIHTLDSEAALHSTILAGNSRDALANRDALAHLERGANRLAKAQILSGASLGSVTGKLKTNTWALEDQAVKAGFNSDAVGRLVNKYKLTPKQVVTYMVANISKATASASQLQRMINAIRQDKVPGLKAGTAQASGVISVLQKRIDSLAQKTPIVVSANAAKLTSQVNAAQRRLDAIRQNRIPGLEVNTYAGQQAIARLQAQINSLQGKRVAVTIDTYNQTHAVKVAAGGGYITGAGSGTSDSIAARLSNGEFVVRASQTAKNLDLLHAINSGARGFAAGGAVTKPTYNVGGTLYASKLGATNAQHRLDSTTLSDIVHGIAGLLGSAHNRISTYSELHDAANALRDAARAGKASSGELSTFAREQARLGVLGRARDSLAARLGQRPTPPTAYDRLATARGDLSQTYGQVKSAVLGSFDISTAGVNPQLYTDRAAAPVSAGSILAQLTKAASQARRFARLIGRLRKDGLAKPLLLQLASAGPAAMDQAAALAAATPKQLLGIDRQYASLGGAAYATGSVVANSLYGPGVAAAQGLVNGLLSRQSAVNAAIRKLAGGMVAQLKHSLGIKSPSTVMFGHGVNVAEGFRLGIASRHDSVAGEGNRMAHKVQPDSFPASPRGGDTFNIYEQSDPVATAHVITRMQQMQARL